MLKEEICTTRGRVCDTCCCSPSTIFCEADLAYLCTRCDSQVHAANKLSSRHKRVWVCEACEQAPAAFICKADAASLCTTCDAVIHSANPLARRHQRVPVMPISGSTYESQGRFLSQGSDGTVNKEEEDEAASWLLFDAPAKNNQNQEYTNEFLFNGEGGVDEYLDLVDYNSCQDTQFSDDHKCNDLQFDDDYKYTNDVTNYSKDIRKYGGGDADSLVPVRGGEAKKEHQIYDLNFQHQNFQLGCDYEASNGGYSYPASLGHSVSMSSLDVGVVPESSISNSRSSISNSRSSKGTTDLFSGPPIQMPTQLTPLDREARVLRYREKKKTRKFEKTIRYASRKAYAETRPRIKGRFSKRTNVDVEVDQMFSTTLITEGGYCIVPSF
ncbi:constans-like protein [Artemisia annua]|uniref:Constans-like protein n=1 Tax=Artemisia annua TaxID=35608 RepID=A0A2U1N2R4_ARTAN|nr:constans-like protein [Artemisia annua]